VQVIQLKPALRTLLEQPESPESEEEHYRDTDEGDALAETQAEKVEDPAGLEADSPGDAALPAATSRATLPSEFLMNRRRSKGMIGVNHPAVSRPARCDSLLGNSEGLEGWTPWHRL
jgi:hypothetical protein